MIFQSDRHQVDWFLRAVDEIQRYKAAIKADPLCYEVLFLEEEWRLMEQKKVQGQPHVEQDSAFSTRPRPAKPVSAKKLVGPQANNRGANGTLNRPLSLNAIQNGIRSITKGGGRKESLNMPAAPTNYVVTS